MCKEKKAAVEAKLMKPPGYIQFARDVHLTLTEELTAALDDGKKLKRRDVVEAISARWKGLAVAEKLEWNAKARARAQAQAWAAAVPPLCTTRAREPG